MGTTKQETNSRQSMLEAILADHRPGVLLLAVWFVWWAVSIAKYHLSGAEYTWIPAHVTLGLDFLHNYLGVNHWLHGGNPYHEHFGDPRGLYSYPPVVLLLFVWCWDGLLSLRQATSIWAMFIALIVSWGVRRALDLRSSQCLFPIAWPTGLSLVLLSLPVVFAMERGNGDAIVLAAILVASYLLTSKKSWFWQGVAGGLLSIAIWIKVYPVLLVGSLIAGRHFKAALLGVVAFVAIGVIPWNATRAWIETSGQNQQARTAVIAEALRWIHTPGTVQFLLSPDDPSPIGHSFGAFWTRFGQLYAIGPIYFFPGQIASGVVLCSIGLLIARRLWHSPLRSSLAYPSLLLATTLGTFMMPWSYDYNLIFLPLLILSVWDTRDPRWVTWLIVLGVLGLCPIRLPGTPAEAMFMSKCCMLAAGVVCLCRRAAGKAV